ARQRPRPCPAAPALLRRAAWRLPPPGPTLFPYTTLFRSIRKPPPSTSPATTSSDFPRAGVRALGRVYSPAHYASVRSSFLSPRPDRKSTRLNSSHVKTSYAVFCLKKRTYRRRPH